MNGEGAAQPVREPTGRHDHRDSRVERDYTPHTPPIEALLARLDVVRDNGRGRWVARCPAHDDRSPSLSIRETSDGTVLIHDHAGCSPVDILAAVGLELRDLFPAPLSHHRPARRCHRVPAHQVLDAISHALTVLTLADSKLKRGDSLDDDEREALDRALAVLNRARRAAK
jgi:hypothetical protein